MPPGSPCANARPGAHQTQTATAQPSALVRKEGVGSLRWISSMSARPGVHQTPSATAQPSALVRKEGVGSSRWISSMSARPGVHQTPSAIAQPSALVRKESVGSSCWISSMITRMFNNPGPLVSRWKKYCNHFQLTISGAKISWQTFATHHVHAESPFHPLIQC